MVEQNTDLRQRHPDDKLLLYYSLTSLLLGPAFPFALLPRYFRYRSLRYTFDAEGISMRWGILFRREISLTYARIQDIHLTSNLLERWLGLARIQIQTASGNAGAEMVIEGLPDFEEIRDELYARMRGVRNTSAAAMVPATAAAAPGTGGLEDGDAPEATPATRELAEALRAAAQELRLLRESLAANGVPAGGGEDHV